MARELWEFARTSCASPASAAGRAVTAGTVLDTGCTIRHTTRLCGTPPPPSSTTYTLQESGLVKNPVLELPPSVQEALAPFTPEKKPPLSTPVDKGRSIADRNGVVHHIGTNFGRSTTWDNPVKRQGVLLKVWPRMLEASGLAKWSACLLRVQDSKIDSRGRGPWLLPPPPPLS